MSWTHLVNALWQVPLPSSLATQSKYHILRTCWMPVIVRIQDRSTVNVIKTLSILLQPLQPSRFDIDIMGSQRWQTLTSQLKNCTVGVWFFIDNDIVNVGFQFGRTKAHSATASLQAPLAMTLSCGILPSMHLGWTRASLKTSARIFAPASKTTSNQQKVDPKVLTPWYQEYCLNFGIDNAVDRQCCVHPPSCTRRAILRVPFVSCRKQRNLTAWGHPSLCKRSIRRKGGPWSLRPGTY